MNSPIRANLAHFSWGSVRLRNAKCADGAVLYRRSSRTNDGTLHASRLVTVGELPGRTHERYPVLTASILTVTQSNGTTVTRECTTTLEMVLRNHDLFAYLHDGGTEADLSPHVRLEWVQWLIVVELTSVEFTPFAVLEAA